MKEPDPDYPYQCFICGLWIGGGVVSYATGVPGYVCPRCVDYCARTIVEAAWLQSGMEPPAPVPDAVYDFPCDAICPRCHMRIELPAGRGAARLSDGGTGRAENRDPARPGPIVVRVNGQLLHECEMPA